MDTGLSKCFFTTNVLVLVIQASSFAFTFHITVNSAQDFIILDLSKKQLSK